MSFVAERITRSHSFVVALPLRETFPLFEPEGERAWADGWNPTYLFPRDGRAEPGMVFSTGQGPESTIWMVMRHDPAAGLVEYVRTTPGSRIARVLVQCAEVAEKRTRVTVIYVYTGLSESGNAQVRQLDESTYRQDIEGWGRAIERSVVNRQQKL
jgi:hypothetical protein